MINENVKRIFNEEALDLINSKNDDYANPTDFYANFRLSEQAGIPMFIGIHVRLLDKISRLNSFISRFYRTGEITANHESIEDTLLDTINYSAIMLDAYRQYTKGKNHESNRNITTSDGCKARKIQFRTTSDGCKARSNSCATSRREKPKVWSKEPRENEECYNANLGSKPKKGC